MTESENYRLLIEREWADLHHSRVQEWTALGIVAGANRVIDGWRHEKEADP